MSFVVCVFKSNAFYNVATVYKRSIVTVHFFAVQKKNHKMCGWIKLSHTVIYTSLIMCRVKKSCILDVVKRLYSPLCKHGPKSASHTVCSLPIPLLASQHQASNGNLKSDIIVTPLKSPSRSNQAIVSIIHIQYNMLVAYELFW